MDSRSGNQDLYAYQMAIPNVPVVKPPVVVAKPKVSLGAPVAPKTMKKSKSYTVYGSLKPKHTKGTKPVRIYKYKKVGSKWKSMGYVKATALNYGSNTRYKVKMKLTSKGKWRRGPAPRPTVSTPLRGRASTIM